MSNISQVNTYTKIKQATDADSRNFGPLVQDYQALVSTASQTVVNITNFVCNLSLRSTIMVYVDGQLLTEGVGNDYVWTTQLNNTSNQFTLAAPISAGLNIQVYKIGATSPNFNNADTIQAAVNLVSTQVDQKNSNKIINGGMDFWQRGTSFAAVANATYTADRFQYNKVGAMVHTIARSTDVPTTSPSLFSKLISCTTVDTSIAATDQTHIVQKIEGNVLRTFKSKNMVLAFWVKATKTGINCISFTNSAGNRSLVREYTVNASNTWERKIIRFTHDASGTWLYDTGIGMSVRFALVAGTTFHTTANTWNTGDFLSTVNQVNNCDNVVNTFQITDVVLVEDNDTTTKVPDFVFAGRDFAEEFQLCQRYLYAVTATDTFSAIGGGYFANTVNSVAQIPFQVPMRVAPSSVVISNTSHFTLSISGSSRVPSAVSIRATSKTGASLILTTAAATAGDGFELTFNTTSGLMYFDAEL